MPTPGEHKTVQARILEDAEVIGWTIASREEAEQRRDFGLESDGASTIPYFERITGNNSN